MSILLQPFSLCVCAQSGNAEDIAKYSKRTVKVTQQHNDECKRLLTLMGVPIVNVSLSFVCLAFLYTCIHRKAACVLPLHVYSSICMATSTYGL